MAANSVGTPGSMVGRRRAMVRITEVSSNRGSMIISCPPSTAASRTVVIAKTWKNGSTASTRSCPGFTSLNQRRICTVFAYRLAWVSIAPFGVPVVPPVYCSTAMSSCGSIVTGCNGSVHAANSGSRMCRASCGTSASSLRRNSRNSMRLPAGIISANGQTMMRCNTPRASRADALA